MKLLQGLNSLKKSLCSCFSFPVVNISYHVVFCAVCLFSCLFCLVVVVVVVVLAFFCFHALYLCWFRQFLFSPTEIEHLLREQDRRIKKCRKNEDNINALLS